MAKKRYDLFTIADLLKWKETAVREMPETPSKEACEAAPELLSFTAHIRGYRTVIAGKLDNGETFAWDLNPFMAQQILLHLIAVGQQMKWLDEHYQVSLPSPQE